MWVVATALAAEARPLAAAWRLRSDSELAPFPCWRGEGLLLAVTGIGRVAMAGAVGYLAGRLPSETAAGWLNVGIAGRREVPLGSVFQAHKVEERASGQIFYPPLVVEPPCATAPLTTVDAPETTYSDDDLYDMEASAFLAAAWRFAPAELVQVVKVVSDGHADHLSALDAARVSALVEGAIPALDALRERSAELLAAAAAQAAEPPFFAELLASAHFTVSDKVALRGLLRRLAHTGRKDLPPRVRAAGHGRRGREVNRALAAFLDSPTP